MCDGLRVPKHVIFWMKVDTDLQCFLICITDVEEAGDVPLEMLGLKERIRRCECYEDKHNDAEDDAERTQPSATVTPWLSALAYAVLRPSKEMLRIVFSIFQVFGRFFVVDSI